MYQQVAPIEIYEENNKTNQPNKNMTFCLDSHYLPFAMRSDIFKMFPVRF